MKIKLAVIASALLVVMAVKGFAHHSFSAEYDWKKPVTITGTVTQFEWMNPHSVLYIDGKEASGTQKKWTLEMGSPQALMQAGWKKTALKAGDKVTVDGWLAKDGSSKANLKSVKLPNGEELLAGSSLLDIPRQTKPDSN